VEVGLEDDSVGGLFPTATVLRIVSPCRAAVVFLPRPPIACELRAEGVVLFQLAVENEFGASAGELRRRCDRERVC